MSPLPLVGSVMRERILSSVDLPAPLRPMTPTTSPGATSKLTSFSAQIVFPPFRRNLASGARNVLTIESRRVRYGSCRAPMWYCLLKFSTLMIGLINQRLSTTDPASRLTVKRQTYSNYVGERALHPFEFISGVKQESESDRGGDRERVPVERPSEE